MKFFLEVTSLLFILSQAALSSSSQCPFSSRSRTLSQSGQTLIENYQEAGGRLGLVNYDEVRADLRVVMRESQEFWPADYGTYAGLFLRLAWHNAGSYRTSDGRGGADGGRQRFEPERSWPDNTNLDKARRLLWPLKMKYGEDLSWGDLFVLAGNEAITTSGGQVLGFCGGRVDAPDGSESIQLGPSDIQAELTPCAEQGNCQEPLGANTIGLIYVNPEGHQADGDPANSAKDIRDVFGRMDMNDRETVALIGGGHTIGKTHGACPEGAGPSPAEDPLNPWPGNCGDGKLENAFTSGFELPFTSQPTVWDTEYFHNLINFDWEVFLGDGGHKQWRVAGNNTPMAISPDGSHNQPIGLLTSDVALKTDTAYLSLVEEFSGNLEGFDLEFARAWYKLTTRDMGPRSRCLNADAPEAQDWQYPLPGLTQSPPDFSEVKARLEELLTSDTKTAGAFTRLAWQCASSFRVTDYQGGCNGARLRLEPAASWEVNVNLEQVLSLLQPIMDEFSPALSWSDLIVLAGTTAMEKASNTVMPFCSAGRVDDQSGKAWRFLEPRVMGKFEESVSLVRDYIAVLGLTERQFAALLGAGYVLGDSAGCAGLFCRRNSFLPSGSSPASVLSNVYFTDLLSHSWQEFNQTTNNQTMYKAEGADLLMYRLDIYFKTEPELAVITQQFAANEALFLSELGQAWTLLMNADMFDGPRGNLCKQQPEPSNSNMVQLSTVSLLLSLFVSKLF